MKKNTPNIVLFLFKNTWRTLKYAKPSKPGSVFKDSELAIKPIKLDNWLVTVPMTHETAFYRISG